MNPGINTQLFEYVLEIERCGSISRAAQNLYLSQPNLSASLKGLEALLGYQIFTRSSAGVAPTGKGRAFLDSARIMAAEMENIRKIPAQFSTDQNNLSIVCVYSPFILNCFMSFRGGSAPCNPKDLFKETGLDHAMADLIAKKYRIGFFYDFESRVHKRWELAEKYYLDISLLSSNIPIVAVVSKEHPLARLKELSVEKLSTTPLVTYEDFKEDDWLGAMGIRTPREVLYIFDRGGMMEIVSHGYHVGIHIGPPGLNWAGDQLTAIPIVGQESRLNQYWMKPVGYRLSYTEESFIRYVKKADLLAGTPYGAPGDSPART
ncbi:MAG: LysR family transcriptional regulator [Oscillibacter sp.]|jgi:DNA-binding transcriptional LysR family regulator|nr:LysR family transcriptional regulator [Oscillibacter sp.]